MTTTHAPTFAERVSSEQLETAVRTAVEAGEVGIQVAAFAGERLIANTWAGWTNRRHDVGVDPTTLFQIFSIGKSVAASALHLQAERGLVDYDAPVAAYWSEFGCNGKEAMTVRHVLSHRSGAPQMPADLTPESMTDWEWVTERLASMPTMWEPGTVNSYGALSFGWVIGELVRRTDPAHRSIGRFIADEITGPFGVQDLHIGLDPAHVGRVAPMIADEPRPPSSEVRRKAVPPAVDFVPEIWNRPDIWAAEIPAAGGIANALSVAKFFSVLANGGTLDGTRYLSADRVAALAQLRPQAFEPDLVLGSVTLVGEGGFWVGGEGPPANPIVGTGRRIVYHAGTTGVIGWADLDTGLSAAILHNRSSTALWDLRTHPFGPISEAIRSIAG